MVVVEVSIVIVIIPRPTRVVVCTRHGAPLQYFPRLRRLRRHTHQRRSDGVRLDDRWCILGQLSLASLRGRLIEYQLRLG